MTVVILGSRMLRTRLQLGYQGLNQTEVVDSVKTVNLEAENAS